MLVVLGELFERRHPKRIAACCEFGEDVQRRLRAVQFLLEQRDIPKRAKQQRIRKPGLNRAPQQLERFLMLVGREQPARDSGEIFTPAHAGSRQGVAIGAAKRGRHDGRETPERQDVDRVVMQNRHQPLRFARAQIFEVDVRDQLARQVAFTLDAEDLPLELHQATVFEAQLPKPPRSMQQIEMIQARERRVARGHAIASLEQRLVVALAVVSDQDIEAAQVLLERGKLAAFLDVLAHEELADAKSFRRDAAHPDQKRVGAAPAREPGCLGIEKSPALRRGGWDLIFADCVEQIVWQIAKPADVGRTVLLVSGEEALGLKMLAEVVADDLAFRPLFDEPARGFGRRRDGGRCAAPIMLGVEFIIYSRDPLPQSSELFFYVQHGFAFYLPSIPAAVSRRLPWFCMRFLLLVGITFGAGSVCSCDSSHLSTDYKKFEYRIPMRDGVHLFTAVYVPRDASQKYPILIARTPYGIAPYGADAYPNRLGPSKKFAEDKFIFVYQDVRGRFMSEGEFVEMRPEKDAPQDPRDVDESTDTYDTIDWLLKNVPNNNGKVGLYGISYPGFFASAGLINAHPALLAVSPQAPIGDLYMGDDAYHNGAFFLIANFSFYTFFGKQHNPELPPKNEKEFDYGTKDGYKFYLNLGPLSNANSKYFHGTNPYWTDVITHTNYDEFWKSRNILPHLQNVRPAVLIVGGWFDAEDLAGTLKTYRAIQQQSSGANLSIVMGPWVHTGWFTSEGDKLGDISFGSPTGQLFRDQIELPFFRHYLKDAPDPNLPKAYMFETGKNVWQRKPQWPPANVTPQRFYLSERGTLSRQAPEQPNAFDEYTSDPNNPVPFYSKPTLDMAREYMDADQRFVERRPDVLTYQTDPLGQDLTIAGPIAPSLAVSTTGTDSDLVVKVIDVYPQNAPGGLSGYEQLVRGEPFRGKFRHSFEHPEPFRPGEIDRIQFAMPDVYHCFHKGHHIMVQIQSSWFPLVDRNPQTFTEIPTASPSQFVKATERIHRSRDAASYIEVNVER